MVSSLRIASLTAPVTLEEAPYPPTSQIVSQPAFKASAVALAASALV